TGKTLYLLDEPTTGLHFADIQHLLNVLNALVDKGNTVVCIEHNMEVVRTADFVVDIGPEGGSQGGEVIFAGTPEALSQQATPTGQALLKLLKSEKVATKAVKKALPSLEAPNLTVVEAETNNLKHVSATLPHGGITICTGPSGSGKSSFAFDTIYAEGQRRYTESLSPYTRQFIKQSAKPPFKEMKGLSPAIAIEQKAHAGNPRSTVGTLTEIYDYLRVLFARKGVAYCPETKEEIKAISKEMVIDQILLLPPGEKVHVLAPIDPKRDDIYQRLLSFQQMGFLRIRIGREIFEMGDTREALEALPIKKQKKQMALVIDRLKIGDNLRSRLFEALESVFRFSHSVIIMREDQPDLFFNMRFAVPSTGKSYPEITPKSFAFNLEEGMCFDCQGLGFIYGAALNEQKSLLENNLPALIDTFFPDLPYHLYHWILDLFKAKKIDLRQPIHTWDKAAQRFLLEGSDELFPYQKGSFLEWRGLNQALMRAARYAESEERALLLPFLETRTCPHCQGSRVNKLAQHVQLNGRTIKDVVEMPVSTLLPFLESIPLNAAEQRFLGEVKEQAVNRTRFLQEMGLSYLSINRSTPTLSGGETQRIRLARQLGSGLTGCLYVLDEPTIGLHPKDGDLLKVALKKLRELGNTLVLVEHDPLMLEIADYILDFGPGAGARGGQIVARGTLPEILKDPRSLTGQYLQGALQIPSPKKRRSFKSFIAIEDACLHNLKKISLQVPIGAMTVLAGVSGSGKSTLMQGILQESYRKQTQDPFYLKQGEKVLAKVGGLSHFNRLIVIDQNPIGHTARSDVGTYVEVLSLLRSVFASLPKAKAKGLEPKHFSYNHRRGMCTGCSGLGYKKIEMHFLPPVKVTCDVCQGMRLNPLSLSIQYQGLNFGDVLKLTVEEALAKFTHYPKLKKVLETLADVGLGYLCLGQEMQSLSGGEAQRIKLSRELSKRSSGKTLYLLDEPTIGLHPDDINKLLLILNRLVDKGNTMVIIEHNLEVLKTADYLIELGPVAGTQGGQVIFAGSPEEMIQSEQSITAPYLLPLIEKKAPKKLSVKRTQNRSKKP
ncbi:MAG: uvrA-A, partial [Chlamydiales bacterium]|nr:uvrA-A [Chlamydiales bacterium]